MKRDAIRARPYYAPGGASTRFYDLTTGADPSLAGDGDLYARLAEGRGAVLELGAGTGRIAIALAERGFDVTGLDIAPAMLAQAAAKRVALPPEVADRLAFVRGDLTSLALGRTFGAIFATYFTLAHVPPVTGWKRAFAGIFRHLAPGGIVGLHLPIAERMAAPPPPPDRPVMQLAIDDGRSLTIYVARQVMTETVGRMDLTLDYVVTAASGHEQSCSREQFTYYAADPAPFAARAGLRQASDPIPIGASGHLHLFERD